MTSLRTASAVYLGTHKADKVYVGAHQILPWSAPFPSTPILDNFNRPNENPLNPTKWFSAFDFDDTPPSEAFEIVSNQIVGNDITEWTSGAWKTPAPGPVEMYVDVVAWNATTRGTLWILQGPLVHEGNTTGYQFVFHPAGGGNWQIRRIDNGAGSTLLSGADVFANGDSVGFRAFNGIVSAWRKPAGGAWAKVGQIADTAYTGGYIGLETSEGGSVWDNFGGGAMT